MMPREINHLLVNGTVSAMDYDVMSYSGILKLINGTKIRFICARCKTEEIERLKTSLQDNSEIVIEGKLDNVEGNIILDVHQLIIPNAIIEEF